ncbi:hypothetical protein [Leminorella grimontii]|uniref:hypothetical protein n=1 Tax=Leminorella grimontii TaxID=82981 RepID=UPI0032206AC4
MIKTDMCFRALHDEIMAYSGNALFQDVLRPAIPRLKAIMASFEYLRRLEDSRPGIVNSDDLMRLFALSVVNDHLLLPLNLSREEYLHFFQELGFEPYDRPEAFTPALCEIISVGNFNSFSEGITLGRSYWPGLRLGELIFSRCAVDVYCPPEYGILNGIADKSVLYFTNQRINRPAHDCSHGWGSNSRWKTAFSRNYQSGDFTFYNVDGRMDLADTASRELLEDLKEQKITIDEARELLVHRCWVGKKALEDDFFPYLWRMAVKNSETVSEWPLATDAIVQFNVALRGCCTRDHKG